jgi:glycosyltransferase involved in cell wall biosynthesis
MLMNVIAVIPCLNEEKFIANIVKRALKYVDKVVVIDDGSADNTSEMARNAGAHVIRHQKSSGAGAATRSGIKWAIKQNADIIITLDGDDQHDPDEIPRLLSAAVLENTGIVIGSRFINPAVNIKLHRRLGISTITFLYNFGARNHSSDSQSGFRAYTRKFLDLVNIEENNYGFSVETLIKARKEKLGILEVPVSCIYHGESHTINPLMHGVSVCWNVVKWRFMIEILGKKTIKQ